jgi:outer membrane receptor protein involved in Fe transport
VTGIAQQAASTQGDTLNTTIGAYAQEQLGFRDRLFLTGALRVDNNSAFGEVFKWVTYPKFGATWVVSDEPFWKFSKVINQLRLRTAYGESGRQPQAFAALRTFAPAPGPNNSSAVTPGTFGNDSLKPEHSREIEAGFEANVLDRLSLDFTYYSKHTDDEIVQQAVAPSGGFSGSRFLNLGRVDDHGLELAATFEAVQASHFGWEIVGSYSTNQNKIRSLGNLPTLIASAGQYNIVGYSIGSIFARRVVSAARDPNGSPSAGWATNIMCDGGAGKAPVACAKAPFVYIGQPTPTTIGSVANDFTFYKRFRLHTLVDFKGGSRVYNANDNIRCIGLVGAPLCRENYYPDEATPVQLAEMTATATAQGMIDEWYQPGSFAKLREVSLTYSVPERLLRGFSRASVTVAGRELHTWTHYKGIDPESSDVTNFGSSTHDQGVIPPLSRILATINLTF